MKNFITIPRHAPISPPLRPGMSQNRLAHLMRQVAQNLDRAAYAELFDLLAPQVKSLLLRRGLDAASAEDVMQDVMVTVWTKAGFFDPARGSVQAWLFTIARNAMIDRIRRNRPDMSIDMIEWDPVDEAEGSEQRLLREESTKILQAALKNVPPDQLLVLQMAYQEELSQAEIATRLGLPLGTVKSRMRLAYARLRGVMEQSS